MAKAGLKLRSEANHPRNLGIRVLRGFDNAEKRSPSKDRRGGILGISTENFVAEIPFFVRGGGWHCAMGINGACDSPTDWKNCVSSST